METAVARQALVVVSYCTEIVIMIIILIVIIMNMYEDLFCVCIRDTLAPGRGLERTTDNSAPVKPLNHWEVKSNLPEQSKETTMEMR